MSSSVQLVESFWNDVWNAHDPAAVDRFVNEDFVIVNAGVPIVGREAFKAWIAQFLTQVHDLRLEVVESFQNVDGTRVASRWRVHGRNNGVLGTVPDGRPFSFTGTAVWEVDPVGGRLLCNHVEGILGAVSGVDRRPLKSAMEGSHGRCAALR
ncbi:nuclear transport factor 2 family protein [Mycobacterium sp. 852013-50091_SCH5140682]|uniref:ester cyclase n=1 Tax=Mycobacterium sp. 852013-50091_SCH5140682 TaxID=1834109 RepID=UPI0012EA0356|nr:nuclear transport factor 2 family protein [Mycobacterium sp. 852013-50091_SCH5140682]